MAKMEICRLCLLNRNHHINIFSDRKIDKNAADIIGRHVGEVNTQMHSIGIDHSI